MSPPIFNPDGSEVSEIVLPDGSTASEVIDPDGNVVFEAGPDIPDTQITRTTDNDSFSRDGKTGLVVNPNVDLEGIKAEISANTSGASTAYLEDTNNNTLTQKDISGLSSGDTVELTAALDSGVDYLLVLDDGGASYTAGFYDGSSYPLTGEAFDVTQRVFGGSPEGDGSYLSFNNIRNLDY